MENKTKIDIELELGDNHLAIIRGNKESVCFDLHEIVNNDDGWIDGFELTWSEIYKACKQFMAKK